MDASRIRRAAIAVATVCILFFGAWLFGSFGTQSSARSATSGAAAALPSRAAAPPAPSFARHAVASEPLPPGNAPVAQVFNTLKQRADAGDAHAACQLAVELLRCRNLPMMEIVAGIPATGGDDNEASSARKGNLAAANFFAQAKLDVLEARRSCKDVSKEQTALAASYLRQAARAGIGDAIVRYVDGQAFDPRAMFSVLQDPLFDAWRREAPGLAMQALHQGNPTAVALLYSAYGTDNSLFGGLVRDDAVQARAYRMLLEKLDNRTSRPDPSLTPEQQQAADRIADRMYHDDFHGEILSDGQDATHSLLPGAAADCR